MRSLDAQLYPEKLKAIAQQVQEQQAQTQSLVQLQQHKQLERDLSPAHSPQVGNASIRVWLAHLRSNPPPRSARLCSGQMQHNSIITPGFISRNSSDSWQQITQNHSCWIMLHCKICIPRVWCWHSHTWQPLSCPALGLSTAKTHLQCVKWAAHALFRCSRRIPFLQANPRWTRCQINRHVPPARPLLVAAGL